MLLFDIILSNYVKSIKLDVILVCNSFAGMFPLEALSDPMPAIPEFSEQLLQWMSNGSLPIIGASPDGMLRYDYRLTLKYHLNHPVVSTAELCTQFNLKDRSFSGPHPILTAWPDSGSD